MKKITDLTLEEFTRVMEGNDKGSEIFDAALDNAYWNIDDYLRDFRTLDYSIGYANYNYLKVRASYGYASMEDIQMFFADCLDAMDTFGLFPEERREDIEHYIDRAEMYFSGDLSDENSDRLYDWLAAKAAGLCDELLTLCVNEYDYYAGNCYEYARDCGLYEDYAVDDDGTLFIPSDIAFLVNGKTFTSYSDAQEEYNRTKALTA